MLQRRTTELVPERLKKALGGCDERRGRQGVGGAQHDRRGKTGPIGTTAK